MNLLDVAEAPSQPLAALLARTSLCARLARFLIAHRGEWLDGRVLARYGGAYAYRTRLSNLRKAPWHLDIENRVRRVTEGNATFQLSEYRLV